MTSIRDFERMLFRCPEVNVAEYPLASYEEFLLMEQDFSSEFVCVFPFVRNENGGKPFVEIYIWDVMLYPDAYKHLSYVMECVFRNHWKSSYLITARNHFFVSTIRVWRGLMLRCSTVFHTGIVFHIPRRV